MHVFRLAVEREIAFVVDVRHIFAAILRAEIEFVPERAAQQIRAGVHLRDVRFVKHALIFSC